MRSGLLASTMTPRIGAPAAAPAVPASAAWAKAAEGAAARKPRMKSFLIVVCNRYDFLISQNYFRPVKSDSPPLAVLPVQPDRFVSSLTPAHAVSSPSHDIKWLRP